MIPGALLILFGVINGQVERMIASEMTQRPGAHAPQPERGAEVSPASQLYVGRAHSIGEETEACKGQATCPSQHREQRAEPGCELPANGLFKSPSPLPTALTDTLSIPWYLAESWLPSDLWPQVGKSGPQRKQKRC